MLSLLAPAAVAAYDLQHGIFLRWHEGQRALVVGTLRQDSPADTQTQTPARYSVEIDSVVFGLLNDSDVIHLRLAYGVGHRPGHLPLPVGEKAVLLLGRGLSRAEDEGREWSISGGPFDFMGADGAPFCRLGPEADKVLRDAPRMIEIAGLGQGLPSGQRAELQYAAALDEWRKAEMRRLVVLGWIIRLGLHDAQRPADTLDFLASVASDQAVPPECRLLADQTLASPTVNRPDYANNTPARTALLIELLAHPDLPEHTREQAERTLADLSRRLEAENAAAPPAAQPQ